MSQLKRSVECDSLTKLQVQFVFTFALPRSLYFVLQLNSSDQNLPPLFDSIFTGFLLNNFIVGLTNIAPNVVSPLINGYTKCGQWPGVTPDSQTFSLTCLPGLPAVTYVIIMISNVFPMSICELEVYGTGLLTLYYISPSNDNKNVYSNVLLLLTCSIFTL
jgi:hypothetical protein